MAQSKPEVRITGTGPNLVTGCLVYDKDGQVVSDGDKCALCACGKTQNPKGLCDGSHAKNGSTPSQAA